MLSRTKSSHDQTTSAIPDGILAELYLYCRDRLEVPLMHVRVQKWGNSLAVRIPKPLAEDAEVKEGTVLNLAVSHGKVVATPVQKRKLSLKQLLAKVNKKKLHAEVDSGRSGGV